MFNYERQLVYKDNTGTVYLVVAQNKLWIDAELADVPRTVGTLRHWLRVFRDIEVNVKKRGITELFAVVSTQDRFNFAEFLGFESVNLSFNNKYEVVRKELL